MKKFQYHQIIKIRPIAKGRPQFNSKTRSAYTPKRTRDYEKEVKEAYDGPLFENSLLYIKLRFTTDGTELMIEPVEENPSVAQPKSKLTSDIDNYAKAVLDALNGVAYTDDKQVVCLYLEKA
jgi:Holliday junction resolvase RusA-like endonuclease